MRNATLIRTNGKVESVKLDQYTDIQDAIGGMFGILPIGPRDTDNMTVFIDDEGLVKELPINMTASLWLMRLDLWPGLSQPIHGDVLIMGGTDEDGETMSVTEDIVASIPVFWREPRFEIITGPDALG